MSRTITFKSPQLLISWLRGKGHSLEDIKRCLNLYMKFHKEIPHSVSVGSGKAYDERLPDLTMAIGTLEAVVYKPMGDTRKPKVNHIHKFGDGGSKGRKVTRPLLIAGGDGNLWILRSNSSYTVDRAGIVF